MTGERLLLSKKMEKEKRNEKRLIENTLNGNYWTGGTSAVSNLLFEDGAKGGKTHSRPNHRLVVGYGKKNPNAPKKHKK